MGQPLCPDCYDYAGHVLFNWHAPELWRRFTIALRRAVTRHLRNTGADVELVRMSFVKVAEYQRRAIIHYHTLIRLDPSDHDGNSPTEEPEPMAIELAELVRAAAHQVRVRIETPATSTTLASEVRMLRFGDQIDTQALTPAHGAASEPTPGLARRVAAHLAKYTTKSVAEFGIAARRISAQVIDEMDIPGPYPPHLSTLASLAAMPGRKAMLAWLHTLGYRGHITTKSRLYSITLTALRAARHHRRQRHADQPKHTGCQPDTQDEQEQPNAATERI